MCREAKEKWWNEKCKEIEELQEKHDYFNVHRKVKEVTGRRRKAQYGILRDKHNTIITDIESKIQRWKEYILELFSDVRTKPEVTDLWADDGAEITKSEVPNLCNSETK